MALGQMVSKKWRQSLLASCPPPMRVKHFRPMGHDGLLLRARTDYVNIDQVRCGKPGRSAEVPASPRRQGGGPRKPQLMTTTRMLPRTNTMGIPLPLRCVEFATAVDEHMISCACRSASTLAA